MADIVIRGMEAPEKCLDCPFVSYDNDICIVTDQDIPIYGTKPSWCPIYPLPEGHGRLIDRDALLEKMKKTPRYFDIKFDLENAPAIIEADKEVEEK